jgi:hypothetical protein
MKTLLVVLLALPTNLPEMTSEDMDACERGGGCLVISRETLQQLIEAHVTLELSKCRNYMKGEI